VTFLLLPIQIRPKPRRNHVFLCGSNHLDSTWQSNVEKPPGRHVIGTTQRHNVALQRGINVEKPRCGHVNLYGWDNVVTTLRRNVTIPRSATLHSLFFLVRLAILLKYYTVSQKNIPDIFDCNVKKDYRILIIFGTNIPETTCRQVTI